MGDASSDGLDGRCEVNSRRRDMALPDAGALLDPTRRRYPLSWLLVVGTTLSGRWRRILNDGTNHSDPPVAAAPAATPRGRGHLAQLGQALDKLFLYS